MHVVLEVFGMYYYQGQSMGRIRFVLGGYDRCYSKYAEEYFSIIDIQTTIHANSGGGKSIVKWGVYR